MQSEPFSFQSVAMRAGPGNWPVVPMVVGNGPMVLQGIYDTDQYWLPFMQHTVFAARHPREKKPIKRLPKDYKTAAPRMPEGCRDIYPITTAPQFVLPFFEHRSVGAKSFERLREAKLPGWDRDSTGKPLTFKIPQGKSSDIKKWCDEFAVGRYRVTATWATLEKAEDAAMVKLML